MVIEDYSPLRNLITAGKEIYRVITLIILTLMFVVGIKTTLSVALLSIISAYCCTYLLELCKLYGSNKLACTFDVLQIISVGISIVSIGLAIL